MSFDPFYQSPQTESLLANDLNKNEFTLLFDGACSKLDGFRECGGYVGSVGHCRLLRILLLIGHKRKKPSKVRTHILLVLSSCECVAKYNVRVYVN